MSNQYNKKHGLFGTTIYWVWHNMKQRCLNKNHKQYEHYGGRGITVCERWLDFENFYADVGEQPKGMTLERRDNDRPYEPDNVYWASAKDQARNRRSTKLDLAKVEEIRKLFASGVFQKEIALKYGVSRSLISHIVNNRVW